MEIGSELPIDYLPTRPDALQVVCDSCSDTSLWVSFEERENLPIVALADVGKNDGKNFVAYRDGHLCLACWDKIKPVKSWEERILEEDDLTDAP